MTRPLKALAGLEHAFPLLTAPGPTRIAASEHGVEEARYWRGGTLMTRAGLFALLLLGLGISAEGGRIRADGSPPGQGREGLAAFARLKDVRAALRRQKE
jgi:hypothetical protein